jgi:hypothetical protein
MSKRLSDEQVVKNTEFILGLVDMFPEPRKSLVANMLEGDVGSFYFSAPASSREDYHYCFPGGLAAHSLNVLKNLNKLAKALHPGRWPDHKLVFVSLFHDLGKAGDGEVEYYVPNPSDWHRSKGMLYEINKDCIYMPTSERGLFILQKNGIVLDSEEYLAIRLNDGQYDAANKGYALKEPDLALLVHWADMTATMGEKAEA